MTAFVASGVTSRGLSMEIHFSITEKLLFKREREREKKKEKGNLNPVPPVEMTKWMLASSA